MKRSLILGCVLAVFSVPMFGCATLKAAQPQLILCAEGAVSPENLKVLLNALESPLGWAAVLTVAISDLGEAGICALQAIANIQVPVNGLTSSNARGGNAPTSLAAELGVNAGQKFKAQCWLEAHGIVAKAALK